MESDDISCRDRRGIQHMTILLSYYGTHKLPNLEPNLKKTKTVISKDGGDGEWRNLYHFPTFFM